MKLTRDVINNISKIKNEPEWMREFRLNSFECFSKLENPNWGPKINIDFDSITYYKERANELTNDWDKISCSIRKEFKEASFIKFLTIIIIIFCTTFKY